MTVPQKAMLKKIDPDKGCFSESAVETRVLNALRKAGLVEQNGKWKYFLTDAGRAALAEFT
jgi:ribosomal protein S19E (S16A)